MGKLGRICFNNFISIEGWKIFKQKCEKLIFGRGYFLQVGKYKYNKNRV